MIMNERVFKAAQSYKGPIQAVILDWAGTAVDHGSLGPVAVFDRAFRHFGIETTQEEIRAPMGAGKRDHVRQMLAMPRIAGAWGKICGGHPNDRDIDLVYDKVQELMPETLANFAEPVPGCAEALEKLRERNIRIGSCTGYSREMMTNLIPRAKAGGFEPDCIVASTDVPQGRPWPWMCWQNCMKMGIYPLESVIKVGDTSADIQEGLNAGHWSVGVTRTGNLLGLSAKEAEAMDSMEMRKKEREAALILREAGAHFVISSIADLPDLSVYINKLLALGINPRDIKEEDDWNFTGGAIPA